MTNSNLLILTREDYLSLTKESVLTLIKPLISFSDAKENAYENIKSGFSPLSDSTPYAHLMNWAGEGLFPVSPEDLEGKENSPFTNEDEMWKAQDVYENVTESFCEEELSELIFSS